MGSQTPAHIAAIGTLDIYCSLTCSRTYKSRWLYYVPTWNSMALIDFR